MNTSEDCPSVATSEANARLIEVVPELLAALEFAAMTLAIQFSDLLPIPDDAPTDTMSEPLTVRAYRSARAAIERATGRKGLTETGAVAPQQGE